MNAYEANSYQDSDIADEGRGGKVKVQVVRRPTHIRTGARPSAHNGMHRRRNKRFSW